jgi:hypothetical protein
MRVLDRLFRKDSSPDAAVEPVQGYCFRCKSKREMKSATKIWMKNGKPRMYGSCIVCGGKISKLVKT